jgi:hypothetical protein
MTRLRSARPGSYLDVAIPWRTSSYVTVRGVACSTPVLCLKQVSEHIGYLRSGIVQALPLEQGHDHGWLSAPESIAGHGLERIEGAGEAENPLPDALAIPGLAMANPEKAGTALLTPRVAATAKKVHLPRCRSRSPIQGAWQGTPWSQPPGKVEREAKVKPDSGADEFG